jgi:hypothetical protein
MLPARRIQTLQIALAALMALTCGCMRRLQLTPTPAARGGDASVRVDLTYDRNNTLQIELSDVPDPSVLNPAYTRYVLWVATPDRQTVVNAGQLRVMENGSAQMQTLTPLRDFILFITAEARGDVTKPGPDIIFESSEIRW